MYDLNGRNVGQYGIIKLGGIKEMEISPVAELIPKLKQKSTRTVPEIPSSVSLEAAKRF